jgi:hypothetical protein
MAEEEVLQEEEGKDIGSQRRAIKQQLMLV